MDTSLKRLRRFVEKHKRIIVQILRTTLVFLYAAVFVIAGYHLYYSLSFTNLEDFYYQSGEERSEAIHVIGITDDDIAKLGRTSSEIAADVVEYLNSNAENKPASIGLDVSIAGLNEESKGKLINASKAGGNVVVTARLSVDESLMLDSFERDAEVIQANNQITPGDELLTVTTLSHNLKVSDKSGVIRHAVFEVKGPTGLSIESLPYVCYKMYCKANNLEASEPKTSKGNTAIIKFSDNENGGVDYSASDLLQGKIDSSHLKNSIVLVGYNSTSLDPGYVTAIDYTTKRHTVAIDADIISNLIHGDLDTVIDYRIQLHILIVMILVVAFFSLKASALAVMALDTVYALLLFVFSLLFYGIGYQAFIVPHIFNIIITSLLFGLIGFRIRAKQESTKLKSYLSQYVDIKVVNNIIDKKNTDLGIGIYKGEKVKTDKVAVLFADIRGFTKISENMEANKLVGMLNDYLSMMAECVAKYGGTLDKFIGDCAMAYWGSPVEDKDAVYHACLAASEMQRRAETILGKMDEYKDLGIQIGIGINYGDAVVGNIGSNDRKTFTVVGDTVNIASRIEELVPAGKIYISENAAEQLSGKSEVVLNKLQDNVVLRGKMHALEIFELVSISVQEITRGEEEDYGLKGNTYLAAIVNFVVFLIQIYFSFTYIRNMGIRYIAHFNVNLSIISTVIMAAMIIADINATSSKKKEYRSKWLDILFLTVLAANIKSFIAFITRGIPAFGIAALTGESWAGGIIISVICPILVCVSFFLLEYQVTYKFKDILLAELPLALTLILSTILAARIGLDKTNPALFNIYYQFPWNVISIALEILGVYLLSVINRKLKLQERLEQSRKNGEVLSVYRETLYEKVFGNDVIRRIIFMIMNAFIAVVSARAVVNQYFAGGIEIYSNPSLVCILVFVCSSIQTLAIILVLIAGRRFKIPVWYNYLSFIKTLGCLINFSTVIVLAITENNFLTLFDVHWGADWTVILLSPFLSFFMMIVEKHEFNFYACVLLALPFIAMIWLSRSAITYTGLEEQYAEEIANFYAPKKLVFMIVSEFLLSWLTYFVNTISIRIGRISSREKEDFVLYACGTRKGICGRVQENSEFGMYSDCYVLKDNKYAIIIGCGSGLIKAAEIVKDCEQIDVLLANERFDGLSGFLAVPNINRLANVRIFSPFNFNGFSAHPSWPVDVVIGTRYTEECGKRFRLNSTYSAAFIANEGSGRSFVKVFGEKSIGTKGERAIVFSPTIPEDIKLINELVDDTYSLVYTNSADWKSACYLAIDYKIPRLMITGYKYSLTDDEIREMESEAKKILLDVEFVRKSRDYIIY